MVQRRRRKQFRRRLLSFGLVLLAVGVFLVGYAEYKLSRLVLGGLGESFSTEVYSTPFVIRNQGTFTWEELKDRLGRLRYPYEWKEPTLSFSLHGFESPQIKQEPVAVTLTRTRDNRWTVENSSGMTLPQIALEPELVFELSGTERVRREPTMSEEIPEILKNAVIAAEDRRFYHHFGIDPFAVARALWRNVSGEKIQGGSTITQQLAKNLFLNSKRTFRRKAAEAFLALYLEVRYSKDHILTLYLNHIYMGQDGSTGVAGVKSASKFYFGKKLDQLTLSEAALLAGLIRSPLRYNPFTQALNAQARRNAVLLHMNVEGMIDNTELKEAMASPVKYRPAGDPKSKTRTGEYFIAEIVRRLAPEYGEDILSRYGLRIYSTMDLQWQRAAERATDKGKHQVALIALDPLTGAVRALVGGRKYSDSQFNRATQALRQPGSAFKPFVYGAALEQGITLSSFLLDEKKKYPGFAGKDRKKWSPQNFDGVFHGTVTVRQALANSMNAATVGLAAEIGPSVIIEFAKRLGIQSPLASNLAIALGVSEVTLLELTASYAPFANGGDRVEPHLVTAVLESDGGYLELNNFSRTSVISPALAYVMTSLLKSPVRDGTAKSLQLLGWKRESAGKTGTTNEGRDAWFIGYTPDLLTGVWVGDDQTGTGAVSGAKDAIPVWASFMNSVYNGRAEQSFTKPDGVTTVRIDPETGFLVRAGCPTRIDEDYLSGTEPTIECPLHQSGVIGFFKRMFGKSENKKKK